MPNRKNPHIPLLPGMATGAYYTQQALKLAGKALTVAQFATDTYKLLVAASQDYENYQIKEKNILLLSDNMKLLRRNLTETWILDHKAKKSHHDFLKDCEEYLDMLHR